MTKAVESKPWIPTEPRFHAAIAEGRHQEAWDYLLCWTWATRGDTPMDWMKGTFFDCGGRCEGLLRYPFWKRGGTAMSFVGTQLAQLNDRLWKFRDQLSEPDRLWGIVAALGRSTMDCKVTRAARVDQRERTAAKRENRHSEMEFHLSQDYWSDTRRRAGSVRKAGYR